MNSMDSLSLSNSISKQTVLENTSMTYASLEEAKKRKNDAISNERIQNGDIILETYEVTSDAISGGMGSVWRVHHQSWNTDLAMKRPQPRFFAEGSEKRKEQFIRECEHWIDLGLHPNIVSCYYVREIGGVPTIFSEWMDNGSLKDRIADGSLYEGTEEEVQERILDIAIQAARGLQYSHENGLIHQDFKPGNLLLTKEWDAKVADFGLAKAKEQLDNQSETAKTTGYTLAYCPKEQRDGEESQRWMDVYAWALTVLEMYAGKRLWETGAEARDKLNGYRTRLRVSVPDSIWEILAECLDKERITDFEPICAELLSVYSRQTGADYGRAIPRAAGRSAEHMNNCALSFLDLGKEDIALSLWEAAEKTDSRCISAVYNSSLYKYRSGLLDDISAVAEVKKLTDRFFDSYDAFLALARIQLECRSCDLSATLDEIERRFPDEDLTMIGEMRKSVSENEIKRDYSFDDWRSGPIDVSPDGKYLLLHEGDMGITETLIFCGTDDHKPISRMKRDPDAGDPSEVIAKLSRDNKTAFGMYHNDPYLYKWRTSDGEQLNAYVMRKLPNERIAAYCFDGSGERVVVASTWGRVTYSDTERNICEPIALIKGSYFLGMTADGGRVLMCCPDDNCVAVYFAESKKTETISLERPLSAHFVLEDKGILIIHDEVSPKISLYDAQTCKLIYELPYPRLFEIMAAQRSYSFDLDGRLMMLKVKQGYLLFDIAKHRWLITITEKHIGMSINAVFKAFLPGDGTHIYIKSFLSGLNGYLLPKFTEDSPWSLSVIRSTMQRLSEENAFNAFCGQAETALKENDPASALRFSKEAAAVSAGKFKSTDTYISLIKKISAYCDIKSVGTPFKIGTYPVFSGSVAAVSISPSKEWIVAVSQQGELAILTAGLDRIIYRDLRRRHLTVKNICWCGDIFYSLAVEKDTDDPDQNNEWNLNGGGTVKLYYSMQSLGGDSEGRIYCFDLTDIGSETDDKMKQRFDTMEPAFNLDKVSDFAMLNGGSECIYRRSDGPVCRYSEERGVTFLLQIGDTCQLSGMSIMSDGAIGLQVCGDIMNFNKSDTSSSFAVFFDTASGKELYRTDEVGITKFCGFCGDAYAAVGGAVFDLRSGTKRSSKLSNDCASDWLDGRFIVGLGSDSKLDVYCLSDMQRALSADIGELPTAIACGSDRDILYSGNAKGALTKLFWDHEYELKDEKSEQAAVPKEYFWDAFEQEPVAADEGHKDKTVPITDRSKKKRGLFGFFNRR